MNQERFWELVSLKLAGEAQSSELAELESFLKENPEEGFRMETLIHVWKTRKNTEIQKKEAFNRHMQRLSNHLSDPVLQYENAELAQDNEEDEKNTRSLPRFRKVLWVGGIAASLIIGIFIFSSITGNKKETNLNASNTVSTKRGSEIKNKPTGWHTGMAER